MKNKSNIAALLGDLIDSRKSNREQVHQNLLTACSLANDAVPPLTPLEPSVGDEIEGTYRTMGEALLASFHLRLALESSDIRFGIGVGEIQMLDAERGMLDGPAWWAARDAIEGIAEAAESNGYQGLRTGIKAAATDVAALPLATLALVDVAISRLRPGARATLIGMLRGQTNAETASEVGISESANSQRIKHNDLGALADAIKELATVA